MSFETCLIRPWGAFLVTLFMARAQIVHCRLRWLVVIPSIDTSSAPLLRIPALLLPSIRPVIVP